MHAAQYHKNGHVVKKVVKSDFEIINTVYQPRKNSWFLNKIHFYTFTGTLNDLSSMPACT